jgi:hypothetical protein
MLGLLPGKQVVQINREPGEDEAAFRTRFKFECPS